MQHAPLPQSNLQISRLGMGCWQLAGDATWGPQDEVRSIEAVHAALDAGLNFFDTAEAYGDGRSEQVLGNALRGRRGSAVIASKVSPTNLAPRDLVAACERSLASLQTDHIDLYQVHWPSRDVPLHETWEAMARLKQQGKVRAIGVSNFGPGDLSDLLKLDPLPASNQLPYNLLTRTIERAVLPMCREHDIGVITYSALMWGLLADKYLDADEVPASRARTRHFSGDRPQARHGEPGCEAECFEAIGRIRSIARGLGVPMSELAVAWLLHQPGVMCVLVGLRSVKQVQSGLAALKVQLTQDVLDQLAAATDPIKRALGDNLDLWQPAAQSRYR